MGQVGKNSVSSLDIQACLNSLLEKGVKYRTLQMGMDADRIFLELLDPDRFYAVWDNCLWTDFTF